VRYSLNVKNSYNKNPLAPVRVTVEKHLANSKNVIAVKNLKIHASKVSMLSCNKRKVVEDQAETK